MSEHNLPSPEESQPVDSELKSVVKAIDESLSDVYRSVTDAHAGVREIADVIELMAQEKQLTGYKKALLSQLRLTETNRLPLDVIMGEIPHKPGVLKDMSDEEFSHRRDNGYSEGTQIFLDALQVEGEIPGYQVLNPWQREVVESRFPAEMIEKRGDTLVARQPTRLTSVNVELLYPPEQTIPIRTLVITPDNE